MSFTFAEGTPRPEGQVLRQPQGGPMEAALNFSLTFLSREKEGKKQAAAIYPKPPHSQRRDDMPAGATVKREKSSIFLRVCGKVVILQAETVHIPNATQEVM